MIYEILKYFIQFIDWISLRQNWNIRASYLSSEVTKLTNLFPRLDQFAKNWLFQANCLSFEVLKLIKSFHSMNRLVKFWVFQASLLSYEVSKLINSFHQLNQLAKKLGFLNKLLGHGWNWLPLFFCMQATQGLQNWEESTSFYKELVRENLF